MIALFGDNQTMPVLLARYFIKGKYNFMFNLSIILCRVSWVISVRMKYFLGRIFLVF